MPTEILVKQGTAKVWKASGGDCAITLAGLADNAGRMGQKADLAGASGRFAGRWAMTVELNMDAAPLAGNVVEVYWAPSRDNTTFPGGVTGSDGPSTSRDRRWKAMTTRTGSRSCRWWMRSNEMDKQESGRAGGQGSAGAEEISTILPLSPAPLISLNDEP